MRLRLHPALWALALSSMTSVGGMRLSSVALPWLVLTTTGNPVMTGFVALAEMLPYVATKALSGPVVDRAGSRSIAMVCDCLSAVATMLVPLLYWAGLQSWWTLVPAVMLIGTLRGPADAARQALIPAVAEIQGGPVARVTGVLGATDRLAGTIGAAGGGVIVSLIGSSNSLVINAIVFMVSAVALSRLMPTLSRANVEPRLAAWRSYGKDFVAGWVHLRSDQLIVALVLMIAFTNMFDQSFFVVMLPMWVLDAGLNVSWVGMFLALFSVAAILSSAMAAAVAERIPRRTVYVISFVFAGPIPLAVIALHPPLPMVVATLLVRGLAAGFLNPIIVATLFERIPMAMAGRVMALVTALTALLIPLGGLYGGIVAGTIGIHAALGITSLFYLFAALAPVATPAFRQMR